MKTLVIYYSLDGSTRLIAEMISKEIKSDSLELKTKQAMSPKGFMKYVWGGRQVMAKKAPELVDFDKNINDYDLLFIGTPVWAWSCAPALRSLFTKYNITDRKIGLFCCHGGGKGKVFDKMRQALSGNSILGEMDFKEPFSSSRQEVAGKLKQWVAEIVARAAQQ